MGTPYYIIYRGRGNGKRKTENGNLRVSESRSKVYFDYAEREQVQDDAVGLNLRVSESMVGTRHAVSDNNSKSGLGMPSPYIPEREQLKRKTIIVIKQGQQHSRDTACRVRKTIAKPMFH